MHIDGPNIGRNNTTQPFANASKLNSVELSKEWRWQPLHEGSIVEPFLGMRYVKFEQWDPPSVNDSQSLYVKNDIIGPQVGVRWYKQKERWIISTEGRYYFAYDCANHKHDAADADDKRCLGLRGRPAGRRDVRDHEGHGAERRLGNALHGQRCRPYRHGQPATVDDRRGVRFLDEPLTAARHAERCEHAAVQAPRLAVP